jgi:hypothetical protein
MVDRLYIHTGNRMMKSLIIALVERGEGGGGKMEGAISPMYNVSLFIIVKMNPPYTMNIYTNKNEKKLPQQQQPKDMSIRYSVCTRFGN